MVPITNEHVALTASGEIKSNQPPRTGRQESQTFISVLIDLIKKEGACTRRYIQSIQILPVIVKPRYTSVGAMSSSQAYAGLLSQRTWESLSKTYRLPCVSAWPCPVLCHHSYIMKYSWTLRNTPVKWNDIIRVYSKLQWPGCILIGHHFIRRTDWNLSRYTPIGEDYQC